METLNAQLRREIPQLSDIRPSGDAPDEMVHLAADALVRPVWDDSARPLSDDLAEQREMRARLWRILGERIEHDDPVARVAFERWLLQPFVTNDPAARVLRPELSDYLKSAIDRYMKDSKSFLDGLRSLGPGFAAIIDQTIEEYDGLVFLTSILERVLDNVLPSEREPGLIATRGRAQSFVDAIDQWIGVNGYIDEAIRETVPAALRYATLRNEVNVGRRLRGMVS